MVQIQIINKSVHPLPAYQTSGSSGVDLHAWLKDPVTLQPLERAVIPTGLYISLPVGYEAQIRPRSGMAIKRGLTVVNAPGTIDSDYRGEIMVGIINLSNEAQTLNDGDRIAQMIIATYAVAEWQLTDSLDETTRGSGGFGHSGTR